MRVRLYSIPYWAGVANVGFTLYISYVFTGNDLVQCRTSAYDGSYGQPLQHNVMGSPHADEIFTVQGTSHQPFQTGDSIQLLASNNRLVGIDHDEEDHSDSVVATDTQPGYTNTFLVTVVQDPGVVQLVNSVNGLDPVGPSQAITLSGVDNYLLGFPPSSDGAMDVGPNLGGNSQMFAVDFLPASHGTPWRRL